MPELPMTVTSKTAARLLGLSESTLAKLRLNGNGPLYCKLGRRVVYRPADIDQWLRSRTARDTTDADARFLRASNPLLQDLLQKKYDFSPSRSAVGERLKPYYDRFMKDHGQKIQ